MKKHNYVDCQRCNHWEDEYRFTSVCSGCNNTKKTIDPKEILCNLCGQCMCPLGTMNEQYPHGLYQAKVAGGYESYHLFDMTSYTFNLCEKCLRQLFMQCKIKPIISDNLGHFNLSEEEKWKEDQSYYEYKLWKDDGHFHQAYLSKKCNVEKDCPNEAIYTKLINNEFSEECCCQEHKTNDSISIKHVKFIPNVLKPYL